jgi:HAD superfamily hydrolase (TIGR01509 family)
LTAPRGVLLDLDGTLTDTTYLHTVCWWRALRRHGHVVPMARLHRAVGMGAPALLDEVLGTSRDHDADDAIAHRHDELFADHYGELVPLPGARALLVACRERGLRAVLASSANRKDLDAELDVLDVRGLLEDATTADDADQAKPSPDILVAALDKSGLEAHDVVYVGDAVWDVEAAGRLEIPCVGLESGGTSRHELLAAGAVETWQDPGDLARNVGDSLLGRLSRGEPTR